MPTRTFICRIDHMGQWFSITIRWKNKLVRFLDSYKIIPMSVEDVGNGFKTEFRKKEMEYKGDRHAHCEITAEEMEYIKSDVLVMHQAVNIFEDLVGFDKMTIASYANADMIKTCFGNEKKYLEKFPNLAKVECPFEGYKNADEWIREGYRGGWTYLKPEYANTKKKTVICHKGCDADANSLYPSVILAGNLPFGLPTWFKGEIPEEVLEKSKNKEIYYFVKIKTRFKLKKNYLPCIQVKNDPMYKPREWLTTSDIDGKPCYKKKDGTIKRAEVTLILTQTDYEMIKEHYELIDCEEIEGCYFKCEKGIFDKYINKWAELKKKSKGVNPPLYLISKLMLNSMYGKQAQSPNSSYKIPFLDENRILKFKLVEDEDITNVKHCAVAASITSLGRYETISRAQKNYKHFIYADTDSLHCDCAPRYLKDIPQHPTEFGYWKIECEWDEAVFVRAKAYIEHVTVEDGVPVNKIKDKKTGEYKKPYYMVKCAGMGKDAKKNVIDKLESGDIKLEEFREGFEIEGNLKAAQIDGGMILLDNTYKLR